MTNPTKVMSDVVAYSERVAWVILAVATRLFFWNEFQPFLVVVAALAAG